MLALGLIYVGSWFALAGSIVAVPVSCPCFNERSHVVYEKPPATPLCHKMSHQATASKKQEKAPACLHCNIPNGKFVSRAYQFVVNLSDQGVPHLGCTQVKASEQLPARIIGRKPPPEQKNPSYNVPIFCFLENFRL